MAATLLATWTVTRLERDSGSLRLRHRVRAVAGHAVRVTTLGARLAIARGWTRARRPELVGPLRLISEHDHELIESALLDVAHRYGPPPRRPSHARPRTPGRRALIAGRAAVSRTVR